MWPDDIARQARKLIETSARKELMIAAAESCTGGLIVGALTEVPGSSSVVDRGFVTYSNAAKMTMLGVSEIDIQQHGAVSKRVAAAMAKGALERSNADLAVAVTGVAGPTGGSKAKPIGTVWLGLAQRDGPVEAVKQVFPGPDRLTIRLDTVRFALEWLTRAVQSQSGG